MTQPSAALDRLHTVVVYHVVNTLGWPSLRALQEQAVYLFSWCEGGW